MKMNKKSDISYAKDSIDNKPHEENRFQFLEHAD